MISEYHRPKTVEEALQLLARVDPLTLPLGGGAKLNQPSPQTYAVVDLQELGLDHFSESGNYLHLGATLSLESLLNYLEADGTYSTFQAALIKAIKHEATQNLRQVATVAGTLISATGRSPFTTVFLALDATMNLEPGEETIALGDLLPLREQRLQHRMVTQVTIPRNVRLAYEYVARTPADQAIVSSAVAIWPSGRVRVVLGGYGSAPTLALDGTETEGVEIAAQSAYSNAVDHWASADYRKDIAGVLALRCLDAVMAET